ncbi:BZ3500_MvSof-1268-A1-R1_Chr1-3g01988 [Microbotryum saponariae]|uniref:BZ3500_MvSof-1268-A1-R1_Chr1-3g01988 protein n=1 Tax=Microbotryum saponariae TaxID=289078 RepID=A0A2X0L8B0_9BASI|nr:BZ3500_MvSof-1268-A1-R1_Chr1-3g01988 [Microbotryum saponariae]SCZ95111.1 BZ3501_MvSof-1269-A2-R1_Chr1-3g01590 [Microbotryum saponariae]
MANIKADISRSTTLFARSSHARLFFFLFAPAVASWVFLDFLIDDVSLAPFPFARVIRFRFFTCRCSMGTSVRP